MNVTKFHFLEIFLSVGSVCLCISTLVAIFKKDFIYLFLDKREERERNINVQLPLTWPPLGTLPAAQACALTGSQTSNPLVCRLVLNPLSHTSQAF